VRESDQVISSRLTYLWKFVSYVLSPFLMAAALVGWIKYFISPSPIERESPLTLPLELTLVSVIVGIIAIRLLLPLKVVMIKADGLIVKELWKSVKIPFSEISNVSWNDWSSLNRIGIELDTTSPFGGTIVFSAPMFKARKIFSRLQELVAKSD
jgi:hypothetical protein